MRFKKSSLFKNPICSDAACLKVLKKIPPDELRGFLTENHPELLLSMENILRGLGLFMRPLQDGPGSESEHEGLLAVIDLGMGAL